MSDYSEFDGREFWDAPVFDIVVDPTGRETTVEIYKGVTQYTLTPGEARRLANILLEATEHLT
jgi:hypothetical protein